MAFQEVNIGDQPSDGSGDPLRISFDKINDNFIELYNKLENPLFGNGMPIVTTVAGKSGNVILGVADVIGAVSSAEVTNRVTQLVNNMLNGIAEGSTNILELITNVSNSMLNDPNFTMDLVNRINQKLPVSGGTLTGNLILNSDPTQLLEAATKQYVDTEFTQLTSNVLTLSGGTLTGNLILNSDPIQLLEAATKQYVDTEFTQLTSNVLTLSGGTLTGNLILNSDPTQLLEAATKQYVDQQIIANVQTLGNLISNVTSNTYSKNEIDQLLLNIRSSDDWGFVTETVEFSDDFGVI